MKRFSFNLESLLAMRRWQEQTAQRALGEASREVERLRVRLDSLSGHRAATSETWMSSHGTFSPSDRLAIASQLAALQAVEEETVAALRQATTRRKLVAGELTSAVQRRQALDALRVRRLEQHQADLAKHETIEMEDFFNARRTRKTNAI